MEPSLIQHRRMKKELQLKKQQKLKEIQKKITYMRAASPPSSLLHSTFRRDSKATREPRIVEIDKAVATAIMKDDVFNQLKRTLKGGGDGNTFHVAVDGPKYTKPSSASSSSLTLETVSLSSSIQSTATSPSKEESTRVIANDYSSLVTELAQRGLTNEANRRKLQAAVKSEIEQQLIKTAVTKTQSESLMKRNDSSIISNAGKNSIGL